MNSTFPSPVELRSPHHLTTCRPLPQPARVAHTCSSFMGNNLCCNNNDTNLGRRYVAANATNSETARLADGVDGINRLSLQVQIQCTPL